MFDFYDDARKFVIRNWAMPFHWLGYIVYTCVMRITGRIILRSGHPLTHYCQYYIHACVYYIVLYTIVDVYNMTCVEIIII